MAPENVKRERDLLGLRRSVIDIGDFWMLVNHDGSVSLHKQETGKPSSQSITIPRRTFQKMVDWYQSPQA